MTKHRCLYLLTLAYATSLFASGILTPIYAFFVQKIGGGILETTWAIAVFSIVTGIAIILVSRSKWSNTYRLECLTLGWFLWFVSFALYFSMNNVHTLYISQVLNGLGSALCDPAYDAEFSELAIDDLSRGWGLWEGITSICSGLAAILGGFVVVRFGYSAMFFGMIAVSSCSFFIIIYYVNQRQKMLLIKDRVSYGQ